MPIQNREEAAFVADAIRSGKLAGPAAERALAELDQFAKQEQYSATRRAEAEQRRAEQGSTLERLVKGAADAPRRVLEAGAQLGAAGAELIGLADPGTVAAQTQARQDRRLGYTGGDPMVEHGADAGEMALLSIPGLTAARGAATAAGILKSPKVPTTFVDAIRAGARAGATGGILGTPVVEGAESPGEVALTKGVIGVGGAVVGGGVAGVAGSRQAFQNFIAHLRQNAEMNRETARRLAGAQRYLGPDTPLTTSQQTGSETAFQIERQVASTRAMNYALEQLDTFAARTDSLVRSLQNAAGGGTSQFQTALNVSKAWAASERKTQQAASAMYGSSLERALTLAGQDPARFPIPFDNLHAVTARWATETGEPWWRKLNPGANSMSAEFKVLDDYLTQVTARNAALNNPPGVNNRVGTVAEGIGIDEVIRIRATLNQQDKAYYAARKEGEVSETLMNKHRAMREMIEALDKDIGGFLSSNPGNRPAVEALRELQGANARYKAFKDIRDDIGQSAVGQMFGFRISEHPMEALRHIAKLEPTQQRIMMNVLRDVSPETIPQLRSVLLEDVVAKMRSDAGPGKFGDVDLDAYLSGLQDYQKNLIGSEIFTAPQKAVLRDSIDAARTLMNGLQLRSGGPGIAFQAEGAAMAGASMSSAFIARHFWRIAGRARLERVLLTKEGLSALNRFSRDVRQARVVAEKGGSPDIMRALTKFAGAMGLDEDVVYEDWEGQ